VQTEPEIIGTQSSGVYSIKPNFKADIDYDINEYERIVEEATTLMDICRIDPLPAEQCVDKVMESVDEFERWSTDCFTGDKRFFYDFVDKYRNCLESEEKDKICEFPLDDGIKDKNYQIRLNQIRLDQTAGERDDKTRIDIVKDSVILLKEEIDAKGPFLTTDIKEGIPDKVPLRGIILTIRYGEEGIPSISALVNVNRDDTDFEKEQLSFDIGNNQLSFYKYEDSSLALIEEPSYSSFKATKETFSPIKRIFNFCVKSEKEFMTYDDDEETTKRRNAEYRFALYFPKNIDTGPT
jgi:hypothetical protein